LAVRRGWQIHGRNLRLQAGEADIVCTRTVTGGLAGLLIEVKSTGQGYDLDERITAAKQERLWSMARELVPRLQLVEVGVVAVYCDFDASSERLTWLELDAW